MNHDTALTTIKEGLFQRYRQIAVIAKRCSERVNSTLR
jgi:hypothetical protein